jgi:rare lipoprotein A
MKRLGAIIVVGVLVGVVPAAARAHGAHHNAIATDTPSPSAYFFQTGLASFYGKAHDGKRTASGRAFNRSDFTAAHPWLPFGTVVRVTNLRNRRMVKVMITDRGPQAKSRAIDVSSAAARELGMQRRGVARVRVEAFDADQ